QVDLDDQRKALADIDKLATRILAEARAAKKMKKPSPAEIREILEDTREILTSLITDTATYIDLLGELDSKESELVIEARKFSDFTREYILWIRSAEPPQAGDARQLRNAAGWLVAPRQWSAALRALVSDARSHAIAWLSALAVLVALAL